MELKNSLLGKTQLFNVFYLYPDKKKNTLLDKIFLFWNKLHQT